jgi:hypothetical protein
MILRRPSYDIIATAPLEVQAEEGAILPVEIRIGQPYREEDHWACPLELLGLLPRPPDARGESAVQALSLALGRARRLLQTELERGRALRVPGSPEVISAEWLQVSFNGCGDAGVAALIEKAFEDPGQEAATRARYLGAESLRELERSLPNGLHDALLRSFRVDLLRRRLAMDLDVWVDEPEKDGLREQYRRALLEVGIAGSLGVEEPDSRYPFRDAGPVRIDLTIEREASEAGPERARFFVNEWNSFITVEVHGALLTWLDLPGGGDDGAA